MWKYLELNYPDDYNLLLNGSWVREGERKSRDKAKNDKILIIIEFKGKIYVCSLYHSFNFFECLKMFIIQG